MSSPPAAARPGELPAAAHPIELPAAFGSLLAAGRLPAWLPPVLATLSAGYSDDLAASRWADRLAGLLAEPNPLLPFAVVHDWLARFVLPVAAGSAEPVAGLRQLHVRAAAGERFGEADWRAALEPALRELYRRAYGYAEAYATAHASASAYARANDFTEQGAISFAESYAAMSTDANRDAFADANAAANAALLGAAYATGDPEAFAETYPFALIQACALASASASAAADQTGEQVRLRQLAYARLAEGLVDSCAAALAPVAVPAGEAVAAAGQEGPDVTASLG